MLNLGVQQKEGLMSTTPKQDPYRLENLKAALGFAKKNPDHPDSTALRKRIESGQLNFELRSIGKPEVPIKTPAITFPKMEQQGGMQSTLPGDGMMKEMGKDVLETGGAIANTIQEGAQNIRDIAGNKDLNVAQKTMGVLGSLMGTGAATIGDVAMGAGKMALSQDAENQLRSFVETQAGKVAETDAAKWAVDWYQNLSPENKLIVDSAGGFMALASELVGGGTASTVTKPLKEGLETVVETGVKAMPSVKQGIESTVDTVSDIFKPSQAKLEKEVVDIFQKGVKPNLQGQQTLGQADKYKTQVVEAVKTIDQNKNALQFTDEAGEIVTGRTPESLQEFSEAIDQTKQKIYEQYDTIASQAGEAGLKVDGVKIANQLEEVINNKALKLSNPEAVRYAEEVRNRFIKAGEIDAKTAQEVIQNYNNSLKAFYKNPTPEGLTRNAVDALMANQMRQALDEGIDGLTGAQYQSLKNQYGALKTIERDVLRATLRDARKNTKGLIDYTDIFSGGQLVTGLLTLNPGMIAQGAAQKGIAEYFKFLNNPNKAIKDMFETGAKLEKEPGSVPLPTRKQLEAPEEGASDVSNQVPINLQERTQSTIDATERVNPNIKAPETTEAKPTVMEQTRGNEQIAKEEIRASMMEAQAGIKQTSEGEYSRYTSFPSWIPKDLRKKELFDRVWQKIDADEVPKTNSSNEIELFTLIKSKISERAFDLQAKAEGWMNNSGKPMTFEDIPFAYLLAGGLGAYYTFGGENPSLMPLAVLGTMNPQTRKLAIKELDKAIAAARKRANHPDANPAQIKSAERFVNEATKEKAKLMEAT